MIYIAICCTVLIIECAYIILRVIRIGKILGEQCPLNTEGETFLNEDSMSEDATLQGKD